MSARILFFEELQDICELTEAEKSELNIHLQLKQNSIIMGASPDVAHLLIVEAANEKNMTPEDFCKHIKIYSEPRQ
jgi:hypothetical protein